MLIATVGRSHTKIQLLLQTIALCLVQLLFAPALADDVYIVCIGDRNLCEGGPWFSCGTSIEQAARAVCTTSTTSAQQVSQFTFTKLSDKPGGRCGYSVSRVTCKK